MDEVEASSGYAKQLDPWLVINDYESQSNCVMGIVLWIKYAEVIGAVTLHNDEVFEVL